MDHATLGRPIGQAGGRRDDLRRDGAAHAQKNELKPWLKEEWCIPSVSPEFVWRMEAVLDLSAEPFDPTRPVVGFDEMPYQLVGEVQPPVPRAPGRSEEHTSELQSRG